MELCFEIGFKKEISKWIIASIIQLVIGILAVIAFAILWYLGEDMKRWIVTVILAIGFIAIGIIGIIDYKHK